MHHNVRDLQGRCLGIDLGLWLGLRRLIVVRRDRLAEQGLEHGLVRLVQGVREDHALALRHVLFLQFATPLRVRPAPMAVDDGLQLVDPVLDHADHLGAGLRHRWCHDARTLGRRIGLGGVGDLQGLQSITSDGTAGLANGVTDGLANGVTDTRSRSTPDEKGPPKLANPTHQTLLEIVHDPQANPWQAG